MDIIQDMLKAFSGQSVKLTLPYSKTAESMDMIWFADKEGRKKYVRHIYEDEVMSLSNDQQLHMLMGAWVLVVFKDGRLTREVIVGGAKPFVGELFTDDLVDVFLNNLEVQHNLQRDTMMAMFGDAVLNSKGV